MIFEVRPQIFLMSFLELSVRSVLGELFQAIFELFELFLAFSGTFVLVMQNPW